MLVASKEDEKKVQKQSTSVLYQPKPRYYIDEVEKAFHVTGAEIKKWVAMTNFDSRDAVERFHRILEKMGVIKGLKDRGVQEGGIVYCEDVEMTFHDGHLGGQNES